MAQPAYQTEIDEIVVKWLSPYQKLFDVNKRWFFCWGGRDAGRSYAVSRKIVQEATEARKRVVCVRWTREATSDSMRADISSAIYEMGLEHCWNLTKMGQITCDNGSVIIFKGLYGQNGLRSLTDIDIAWIEAVSYTHLTLPTKRIV